MMDWKTSETPLARMDGESLKANQALVDYAMLGGGRSFAKLLERYQSVPEASPTLRLPTIKDWSSKFDWQARVAQFDALQQKQELAKWSERAEKLREREWKLAETLMDKAEQMLKFPLAEVERTTKVEHSQNGKTVINHITVMNPSRWYFGDAARVIKDASRVGRLATGQETDNTKHSGEVTQIGMTLDEWRQRQQERRKQVADTLQNFANKPDDE